MGNLNNREAIAQQLEYILKCRKERFGLVSSVFFQECPEETVAGMLEQAKESDSLDMEPSIEADLSNRLRDLKFSDITDFATLTRTEYARLFIGPREVIAPLHESAYLSGTSRMFTKETLEVRAFYKRYGYVMRRKNREPEDGIGIECEFLGELTEKCLDLLCKGFKKDELREIDDLLQAQKDFEDQHLNRWSEAFIARVLGNDRSGFYAAWAEYLSGVIAEDAELLELCQDLVRNLAP